MYIQSKQHGFCGGQQANGRGYHLSPPRDGQQRAVQLNEFLIGHLVFFILGKIIGEKHE